jgi:glycosyltransferase involved in cell wall biosynthesis
MRRVKLHQELGECVEFTGWVEQDELLRRLDDSDAFVLLRAADWGAVACFPTRVPELLLTSKPLILSGSGDFPLYFADRINAVLLGSGDQSDQLASAISFLHRDPISADRIGQAGAKTALADFSYRENGVKLLAFMSAHLRLLATVHAYTKL